MKKLYTLTIALSAVVAINAQTVVMDIADQPNISTVQLSELKNHGSFKYQPASMPTIQAPLTFDVYYNRKTQFDVPVFTIGSTPFLATYSHGLPGKIGVNFDNSVSRNIDRFLVNFFAKASGTTPQTFYAYIYNRGASDSLPTGAALGTKAFGYHDVTAPVYGTGFDSLSYTTITFSSAVNVTGPFVAAVQIDNATTGSRERIGISTNKCLNPGNGNGEKRMCVYPVPGASGVNQQWYKFNDFFNTALGSTSLNWNCEAMIIPLVVGESSPLGVDNVVAAEKGLALNGHYPSPANAGIKINYTTDVYSNVVNLRVFDITGRTIYESNHVQQAAGKYNFDIELSSFASGEYFYTISTDSGSSISSHFMVTK